jgi:branched-chain amino acid transport system permease protein
MNARQGIDYESMSGNEVEPSSSGSEADAADAPEAIRPRRRRALQLAPLPVILVILALMPLMLSATSLLNVQSAIGLALFACAANLLIGYGGLVSFGQGAFYGIGAYVVALMWMHWQTSFWLGFVAAPFVGAFAALLVGVVALRTRRLYFALLTLAFTQLFYVLVLQQEGFTGGANGVFGAILPSFLTDLNNGYYFTLAVVVIALLALWRITRSPFGLTLRAIRENRERAESLGVNVFRHQLLAFVFAGAFCALAGTLFVVHDQSANPNLLNWTESGYPIFMAVIGGQFLFLGPALGALIYEQGRDVVLASVADWQLVFGLLLLAIVIFAPDGVLGLLVRGGQGLLLRRRRVWATSARSRSDLSSAEIEDTALRR